LNDAVVVLVVSDRSASRRVALFFSKATAGFLAGRDFPLHESYINASFDIYTRRSPPRAREFICDKLPDHDT